MIRVIVCCSIVAILLAGCGTGGIDPPKNYLPIAEGIYKQRFVSNDQNVIAVRTVDNPKGGTLEFWSQAVQQELTGMAGYTLKESQPIKAGRLDGVLHDFRTSIDGVEHTYLTAVFVTGGRIALVEAGGKSETIAKDRDKLIKSIQSLRAGPVLGP